MFPTDNRVKRRDLGIDYCHQHSQILIASGKQVSCTCQHMMPIRNSSSQQWFKPKRRDISHPFFSIIHIVPCLNYLINLEGQTWKPKSNSVTLTIAKKACKQGV